MSDFDKEAEREKLREKFERDKEKRESTQRMSELLLKGATMTNRHCDTCGDPIFRYDGQEFCPTCQQASVEEGQQVEAGDTQANQQASGTPDVASGTEASDPSASQSTSAEPEEGEGPEVTPVETRQESEPAQPTAPGQRSPSETGTESRQQGGQSPQSNSRTQRRQAAVASRADTAQSGDLSQARASLARTVTRFAQEAESADDPRRAKELLAAAREAAETLGALEQ